MEKTHVDRLLYETSSWNEWRRMHPEICPDLSDAELNPQATKSTLDRSGSIFERFQRKGFRDLDLHGANLRSAKIWISDFSGADFSHSDLSGAEIRRSQLRGADLRSADLRNTQFLTSDLRECQLAEATLGQTHFGNTRLRGAKGLDRVRHADASYVDQFSLISSMPLDASFLKASGLQPHTIRMADFFLRGHPYSTCFVSYSRRDEAFVGYLREALTWACVPTWFAPMDMRSEEHQADARELERDLFNFIDEAERFLLIVSPNILPSHWVARELERARQRKPVTPLLIESMPTPGGAEWNRRLSGTAGSGGQNREHYSTVLAELLSLQHVEFRDWRNPNGMAYYFSHLLPRLVHQKRDPSSASPATAPSPQARN